MVPQAKSPTKPSKKSESTDEVKISESIVNAKSETTSLDPDTWLTIKPVISIAEDLRTVQDFCIDAMRGNDNMPSERIKSVLEDIVDVGNFMNQNKARISEGFRYLNLELFKETPKRICNPLILGNVSRRKMDYNRARCNRRTEIVSLTYRWLSLLTDAKTLEAALWTSNSLSIEGVNQELLECFSAPYDFETKALEIVAVYDKLSLADQKELLLNRVNMTWERQSSEEESGQRPCYDGKAVK